MNIRTALCTLTVSLLALVPAHAQNSVTFDTQSSDNQKCDTPTIYRPSTPNCPTVPSCPPNAVPEPSTLALGLIGLLPLARRRRRS